MDRPAILNSTTDDQQYPFGPYEEEAIISLFLDHPDLASSIHSHINTGLFKKPEVQYIIAHMMSYYNEHSIIPSRELLYDMVAKHLTIDVPNAQDILDLIKKKSNSRDIPGIKKRLLEWARHQAYSLIYSKDTIERFNKGDYAFIEEKIEKARSIQDTSTDFVNFWDEIEGMFVQGNKSDITSGFKEIDMCIDTGGPCRKEVLLWMAPTGVGKSIMLANNAIVNSKRGHNVAYFTLELSDTKSALRIAGAGTDKPIDSELARKNNKDAIVSTLKTIRQNKAGDIRIIEFPADSVSVVHLENCLNQYKKMDGWVPDVVIIDYLELLLSSRSGENDDSYKRQKSVSVQVRAMASKYNVCIFSATQTNRDGNNTDSAEKGIDLTKISESYGKSMAVDYIISINQTQEEYASAMGSGGTSIAPARLYIAKNRNGKKFETFKIKINYKTMTIKSESL